MSKKWNDAVTDPVGAVVRLKPDKQKSLRQHHPWVFSGALASVPSHLAAGTTVEIITAEQEWLARGAYSPQSQIAVRVWSFNPDEAVDEAFFYYRLQQAVARRQRLMQAATTTAWRLVNAEADGLPGLIVDQYGAYLVLQCLSAGIERWKTVIVEQLQQLLPVQGIYERSDGEVRHKEGLIPCKGLLAGEVPEQVTIQEHGLQFRVDIHNGHKTGFYLDQRDNRQQLATYTAQAEVLNCFAYTGGFGLAALQGGAAHLTNLELSQPALDLLTENLHLNPLAAVVENHRVDVFAQLRQYRNEQRQFDVIILDPPKFADSRNQLTKALRGYKDINWLAFRLLRPGGILFTFSCSGLLEPALFQKIVADAALDAKREAQIIQRLGQPADHPIALNFPEGHYLKGLVCQVD